MTKNKKNLSKNKQQFRKALVLKKKPLLTVWDHHDTMIVNLRSWVDREIDNINADIDTHAPKLRGKSKLETATKKAQEYNLQLWDQIRIIHDMANSYKAVP